MLAKPLPPDLVPLWKEALSKGVPIRLQALGGSMRPLIPEGSIVEIGPQSRNLRVGDVVAATVGRRFVIHRVIALSGDTVHLRGDLTLNADPAIKRFDVIGVACRITTPGGWQVRLDTPLSSLFGYITARAWPRVFYPWLYRLRTHQ